MKMVKDSTAAEEVDDFSQKAAWKFSDRLLSSVRILLTTMPMKMCLSAKTVWMSRSSLLRMTGKVQRSCLGSRNHQISGWVGQWVVDQLRAARVVWAGRAGPATRFSVSLFDLSSLSSPRQGIVEG
jgi:hypothetical protein